MSGLRRNARVRGQAMQTTGQAPLGGILWPVETRTGSLVMRLSAATTALVSALLLGLTVVVPTQAQESPTISFEGTHAAGGTIRFTVGRASGSIEVLELEGVAGGGCSWDTIDLANWGGPIPIEGAVFKATNPDGDAIVGEFLDHGRVEGTVEVTDPVKGCRSTPLRWVANVLPPS
jgi:hypothetical protein